MIHQIAFNAFRGGNKGSVSSLPLTEYDKTLSYPWLHQMVEQIRGHLPIYGRRRLGANGKVTVEEPLSGKPLLQEMAKIKSQLPFRCAHYAAFRDNKRRQANILPEAFLYQTTVDVDEKDLVETALEMAKLLDTEEFISVKRGKGGEEGRVENPWRGKLLHLEYSARKKLHIDIRMPIGMTIEEAQRAYCDALGVPCDESCFSPERIIFITDKDSEIYRSPEWYGILDDETRARYQEAFRKRGLDIDGRKRSQNSQNSQQLKKDESQPLPSRGAAAPQVQFPLGNVRQEQASVGFQEQASVGGHQVSALPAFDSPHSDTAARDSRAASAAHRGGHGSNQVSGGTKEKMTEAKLTEVKQEEAKLTEAKQTEVKNLIVFDLFQEQAGLKGVNIDSEGSRHSSLLAIMSAGASRVMSAEALSKVVEIRMPSFAQEHDCRQLIRDFYDKYCDATKPMSQTVIRINAIAERLSQNSKFFRNSQDSQNSQNSQFPQFSLNSLNLRFSQNSQNSLSSKYPQFTQNSQNSQFSLNSQNSQFSLNPQYSQFSQNSQTSQNSDEDDYPAPPPMPEKLPKLVSLLVSKTPDIYKPAVAHAIFPPLATHLWKTTFRYIDNVDHEATLMCALLAGTGAGKNCVQMPINLIMADIRKRDQENLAREKAWKDEVTRKGANKDKRKRPDNLIIQEIDADMTNPAFVMRTSEAQEHFLYTSLNEIDQFDALKGQGSQQFRIMCLAFDPGNQYGQTRVGTQSVTERVCIRFNWNASTTIHKGQRYFGRVLTDGPISRINFCTIPEREIGAEMPVYGTYDEQFQADLQPYIDNLCRANGRIECAEAYQLALKLKDENADFARMTQSRIYENLSFRANVIAYLKACVLYVANGCQWEKETDEFIRWSERYDLWCKMRFFGDAIAKADTEGVKSSKRGPRNMLQQLPDEFTLHEAEAVRLENGLDQRGTKLMLNTWVHRGYIKRKASANAAVGKDGKNAANAAVGKDGKNAAVGHDSNDNYSYDSFEKLKFRRDGREAS